LAEVRSLRTMRSGLLKENVAHVDAPNATTAHPQVPEP
jgi:hypothetical protein